MFFLLFVLYLLSFSMGARLGREHDLDMASLGAAPSVGLSGIDAMQTAASAAVPNHSDEAPAHQGHLVVEQQAGKSGEQADAFDREEALHKDVRRGAGHEMDESVDESDDAGRDDESQEASSAEDALTDLIAFESEVLEETPYFTRQIAGAPGVQVIFGNLSNAFRWEKRDQVRKRLDLPRVFPVAPAAWARDIRAKRSVCVFTRTPRQDSLFKTNIMSMFGSGDYNYKILRSTDCQHWGSCPSPEVARRHLKCRPDTMPTVHLLERIKNFGHERFEQVLQHGTENYDVLVATGDEFCRATNTFNRAHFRMYSGDKVVNSSLETPIYLPLGPREEFERVSPADVKLVSERQYVFNFLGSLTSPARTELVQQLKTSRLKAMKSFLHVIQKWGKKLTKENGYMPPATYKQVLLSSIFTLCPQGHNPEAFRIYEACEAGSIPIVVLDGFYRTHECNTAYGPLIKQGAPFVFLNGWHELPGFLEIMLANPARLQQMQADVMAWYGKFMQKVAGQFEQVLELRFQDRMDRGKFTSTGFVAGVQAYLDDPKYDRPLR
mmetsp:Transcript_6135/g.15627  ORF Transcript_6135/g.15627 Transcript_6135/m.15627 type:complete len:551 (+) Transcript_6135:84-1736(+)